MTFSSSFSDNIQILISQGKLKEVIIMLQDGNHWIPKAAQKEMLLLSIQLRELRQQEIRGVISKEEVQIQESKIKGILDLFIENYFNHPKKAINKKLSKKIKYSMLIVLIFVAMILIKLFFS